MVSSIVPDVGTDAEVICKVRSVRMPQLPQMSQKWLSLHLGRPLRKKYIEPSCDGHGLVTD